MTAFILTWSPSRWTIDDDEYADAVIAVAQNGESFGGWATGNRKHGIAPGDTGLLLRQHRDRGLVAAGTFTSEVFQDTHWAGGGKQANYADLRWTAWVPLADRLPVERLKAEVPEITWDRVQGSGVRVPDVVEQRLLDLWAAHVGGLGKPAEEVPPGDYLEGSVQKVLVNRYERNPQARQTCIEHYGPTCAACEFDFEQAYGPLGAGYIEVHHLKEISTLPDGYKVNPVKDLRPVCANCHAMLHRRRPALSITALRKALLNGS